MQTRSVARYTNAIKRLAAQIAAERQGYEVRSQTAQGVPERARFELRRPNEEAIQAVVRTSEEGLFGFRRDIKGGWKPLKNADLVVTAMKCNDRGRPGIEVLAFAKETIVAALDAALAQLLVVNKAPPNEIPVFISIDPYDKADFGHPLPGIRNDKCWGEIVPAEELMPQVAAADHHYIEDARREFARRNGVDIRRVTVTFSVGP